MCVMRASPSVTFNNLRFTDSASYDSAISAIVNLQAGTNSMRIGLDSTSNMTALRPGMINASATGGGLFLSSEL
jgi:hypothetical protein